jgi:hypothetical protein
MMPTTLGFLAKIDHIITYHTRLKGLDDYFANPYLWRISPIEKMV